MKISTRGRYAVRALLDLALHGSDKPERLSNIARRQEIPLRYLERIFLSLKENGIIKSKRGSKGGYLLGREPEKISIFDVLQITEESLCLVGCREYKDRDIICHRAPFCAVKPVWDEASRLLNEYLNSVTIADVLNRPQPESP
jgi:Rrf2 family protein